ncbi:MAG: TIGR02588 family protein [Cyanobacteria bacterium P01_A01_bin.83]
MPKKSGRERSPAERVSLGISLFIVGLIIVLICYTWITGDNNPPVLFVSQSQARQVEGQYYVPFTVTNAGGKTAESVEIVAQLLWNNEVTEIGRQEVDFLSRQEKRSGEFVFSKNPQQGELTIRVASYKLP